jgi:hexosaminidase
VDRVAWRFGDESRHAVVRPRHSPAGEIEVHADTCAGPLLASLPLAPAAVARGQTTLHADIPAAASKGARDLCFVATGDPRDGQWTLARAQVAK